MQKTKKGITDNKTARVTIDSIMSKLKNESFNQLIIVIEYGRASVDFYNHLEIVERCLNGVVALVRNVNHKQSAK
jgi:hypothetical protein